MRHSYWRQGIRWVTILGWSLISPAAFAATVTITSDTIVGSGDLQLEDDAVIVDGVVLTLNGAHRFASLHLKNGATLTHEVNDSSEIVSIELEVIGTVRIDAGCAIDASAKGYLPGQTLGATTVGASITTAGGSHGGLGYDPAGSVDPAWVYDSFRDPVYPGSGGGEVNKGGHGGGMVRLKAGSLVLDGNIAVNGSAGWTHWTGTGGGGGGGSVRLELGGFSGSGLVTANGGESDGGGGGGGGRVVVVAEGSAMIPISQIEALGGAGTQGNGAAGTIFLRGASQTGELWIDSRDATLGSFTPLGELGADWVDVDHLHIVGSTAVVTPADDAQIRALSVSIEDGGILTHRVASVTEVFGLDLVVEGTLSIDADSGIDVSDRGYPGAFTEGFVTTGASTGYSGGSYGGLGSARSGQIPNWVYGNFREPISPGSGGGTLDRSGAGGGVARVRADEIVLNGFVRSNGKLGTSHWTGAGGSGSGGSIWIATGKLSGTGTIQANGGPGTGPGAADVGCGGGGRIAVHYEDASAFGLDAIESLGGTEGITGPGSAGTVFLKPADGMETLLVHDGGLALAGETPIGLIEDGVIQLGHLVVKGTTKAVPIGNAPVYARSVQVSGGAVLSHRLATEEETYVLDLRVVESISVDAESAIDVSARGYLRGRTHPNTVEGGTLGSSGGSYGGRGFVKSGFSTNATYGDSHFPIYPGSGSGPSLLGTSAYYGASGGGAVRLETSVLQLDGAILADGGDGGQSYYKNGGGGSGGAVALNVGTLSGAGLISADGGASGGNDAGSGGGGRIAVYCWESLDFDAGSVHADAGVGGAGAGEPGSVAVQTEPYVFWLTEDPTYAHGSKEFEVVPLGLDPEGASLGFSLVADENVWMLQEAGSPVLTGFDSTVYEDGWYGMVAEAYDDSGNPVAAGTLSLLINNAAAWHSGEITGNVTWSAGQVHIIEGRLALAAGAVLTVEAGTVVKVAPGGEIVVADGGQLTVESTVQIPTVLTSLRDDTAAGDTNLDGAASLPVAGDWRGLTVVDGGVLDLAESAIVRFLRLHHAGVIGQDETWLGDAVHTVEGTLEVPDGTTLDWLPGAVIKFQPAGGILVHEGGRLTGNGTVAKPIICTSMKDDTVGGDTNGDGLDTRPSAGDWRWIFADRGVVDLTHTHLLYGGKAAGTSWDTTGALRVTGSGEARFSDGIIRDAFFDGALAYPGGTLKLTNSVIAGCDRAINADSGAEVEILNCTIDDSRIGVWGHGGSIQITNTIISNSLESGIDNVLNSPLTVSRTNVWSDSGADYRRMTDPTGTDGNISVDPGYRDPAGRSYRLGYASPMIDAADGTDAPALDAEGMSRYDDPRVANTGSPTSTGTYADLGAYEFVETAPSAIDLQVIAVSGPSSVEAGETVTITWTIRNLGSEVATGPWIDQVLLTDEGGTTVMVAAESSVDVETSIGPGADLTRNVTVRVPGGVPGLYRWAVRTNARGDLFEGINQANNLSSSLSSARLALPLLITGQTPLAGAFGPSAVEAWYQIQVDRTSDVLVTLTAADETLRPRLYASAGSLPSVYASDWAADPESNEVGLVFPAGSGSITILARVDGPVGAAGFTIGAVEQAGGVSAVSPSMVGTQGAVTLKVSGSGFAPTTVFDLVGTGGTCRASEVYLEDSTLAFPTFDLNGYAAGAYDLRAGGAGSDLSLDDAVTVVAGEPGEIRVDLATPAAMRFGTPSSVDLIYENTGLTDVVAPLVGVSTAGGIIEPWLGDRRIMMVLGVSPDGPAGVLRAGARHFLTIPLTADQGAPVINVSISGGQGTNMNAPVPWSQLKIDLKPGFVEAEAWDRIWSNLMANTGPNMIDLNRSLASAATETGRTGVRSRDALRFLSALLSEAGFEELGNRYGIGSLGRGQWADWDLTAEEDPDDGDILLRRGGGNRLFRLIDSDYRLVLDESGDPLSGFRVVRQETVGYEPGPGDFGRVEVEPSGRILLHERDGGTLEFADQGGWTSIRSRHGDAVSGNYTGGDLTGIVFEDGAETKITRNGLDLVSGLEDTDGWAISMDYDESGPYLETITSPDGEASFEYATSGGGRHAPVRFTLPDGSQVLFSYDGQGRLTSVSGVDGIEAVTYGYDDSGNVTVDDGMGPPVQVMWSERRLPSRYVSASGDELRYTYDDLGNLTSITGPDGLWWKYELNSFGDLTGVIDGLGNRRSYRYNEFAEVIETRDGNGNRTQLDRGSQNLFRIIRPDGSATRYEFADSDQLARRVDGRGRVTTYEWNDSGYLDEIHRPTGGDTTLMQNERGELTRVSNGSGALRITRDAADRIERIDDPNGRWIVYGIGPGGRRTSMTTSDGHIVRYEYDAYGRLVALRDGDDALIESCSFDSAGRVVERRYGNGTRSEIKYRTEGYVDEIVLRDASDQVLSRIAYQHDRAGRVQSMESSDGTWTYEYDAAGALVRSTHSGGAVREYAYDAAGNRTSATGPGGSTGYQVNSLNHYTRAGGDALIYDLNGNLTRIDGTGGTRTFEFDDEDRLTHASGPDGTWDFEYDGLGSLVAVVENGNRTEFLVDPAGDSSIVAEYDAGGDLRYFYAGGMGPFMREDGSGHRDFFWHDGLGHARALVDASGDLVEQYGYAPFGEDDPGSGEANRFRYGGRHGLMSFGDDLIYVRRRFYCPSLGRFLSEDRVYPDGRNLYAYAQNDPVNRFDSSGEQDIPWILDQLYGLVGTHKNYQDGSLNVPEELITKGLGLFKDAMNYVGDIRLNDLKKIDQLELRSRLAMWVEGNPAKAKELTKLGEIYRKYLPSEKVTKFLKAGGAVLDKGLKAYTIGKSAYETYNAVQDWRKGKTDWVEPLCSFGKSVGAIWGTFSPVHGALFTAGDWLSAWGAKKYYEMYPPETVKAGHPIRVPGSHDPNEIVGPAGAGDGGWVLPGAMLPYTIRFENDPEKATAPAQLVTLTQTLDDELDLSTFELGEFGFGDRMVPVPAGLKNYTVEIDLRPEMNLLVRMEATLDESTREAKWVLTSLDPTTGRLTEDPFAGFLPPNETKPEGEGYVTYRVSIDETLTEASIPAQASIVFDLNDAIETNIHLNQVDGVAPASSVVALAGQIPGGMIDVSWLGQDDGSAGLVYDVYVSTDGGAFVLWLDDTNLTSGNYAGEVGHSYGFYCRSRDLVGNEEIKSAGAETTTSTIASGRLINISTRGLVLTGGKVMIPGFVIEGSEAKEVLVRGVGPTLGGFGVKGVLENPVMQVYAGEILIEENDDWEEAPNLSQVVAAANRVGAFDLAPESLDACVLLTLDPGRYTVRVAGANETTGVALVEVYDASASDNPARLVNISNRGEVGVGERILIPGFVVSGKEPRTLLIRGVGPTLATFGVGGVLEDPILTVSQGKSVIDTNDNWEDVDNPTALAAAMAAVGAFPLIPGGRDAALIVTLNPGAYTVQVAGVGGTSGVALVELYEVIEP